MKIIAKLAVVVLCVTGIQSMHAEGDAAVQASLDSANQRISELQKENERLQALFARSGNYARIMALRELAVVARGSEAVQPMDWNLEFTTGLDGEKIVPQVNTEKQAKEDSVFKIVGDGCVMFAAVFAISGAAGIGWALGTRFAQP